MDSGTVVEILREEVGVERGTHQDDLQVWPLHDQVLQHQQEEVTEGDKSHRLEAGI